jgi:hypothetical protein
MNLALLRRVENRHGSRWIGNEEWASEYNELRAPILMVLWARLGEMVSISIGTTLPDFKK